MKFVYIREDLGKIEHTGSIQLKDVTGPNP
jgi:hypothetical protein